MFWHQTTDDRVTSFVIGGVALFFFRHRHRTTFCAHENLVTRPIEMFHAHLLRVLTRGKQCGFVTEVREIRTREARRTTCDRHLIDVVIEWQLAHVDLEDFGAALDVRQTDDDLAVETAWTQQRRIQNVRTVRCSDDDHAFTTFEAIHLHQQLVQRLLTLIVTTAETRTTMATHGVNFIDEDDAWGVFFGLVKHIADARCTDTDEHFHEVRAGNREKRHTRLTRNRTGEQRLTGARRTDHQDAAWNLATQLLETRWITQKLNELADFFLRFITTGDVSQSDFDFILALHLRARLAERHCALRSARLHLAHHVNPEPDEQHPRQNSEQHRPNGHARSWWRLHDFNLVVDQVVDHLAVPRRVRRECGAILAHTRNRGVILCDLHLRDPVALNLRHELVVIHGLGGRLLGTKHLKRHQQTNADCDPEDDVLHHFIHYKNLPLRFRYRTFAHGEGVNLRRSLTRGFGLADDHFVVTFPHVTDIIVKSNTMEQFNQKIASHPEMLIGEVKRQFR